MTRQSASPLVASSGAVEKPVLHLFRGPNVTVNGHRKEVPEGSKRLLVFVALRPGGQAERRFAAGTLWPIGTDVRAAGNLRSALWRLRRAGIDVLATDKWSLALREEVVVDARLSAEWAKRIIGGTTACGDLAIPAWCVDALDLLPSWYDEWVLIERERLRQQMLHALEVLSRGLAAADRCAEAVEAAMIAVGADRLRESAQRTLVEAHMAEGNLVEARRCHKAYCDLLYRELGTSPPDLASFIAAHRKRVPHRDSRMRVVAGASGVGHRA